MPLFYYTVMPPNQKSGFSLIYRIGRSIIFYFEPYRTSESTTENCFMNWRDKLIPFALYPNPDGSIPTKSPRAATKTDNGAKTGEIVQLTQRSDPRTLDGVEAAQLSTGKSFEDSSISEKTHDCFLRFLGDRLEVLEEEPLLFTQEDAVAMSKIVIQQWPHLKDLRPQTLLMLHRSIADQSVIIYLPSLENFLTMMGHRILEEVRADPSWILDQKTADKMVHGTAGYLIEMYIPDLVNICNISIDQLLGFIKAVLVVIEDYIRRVESGTFRVVERIQYNPSITNTSPEELMKAYQNATPDDVQKCIKRIISYVRAQYRRIYDSNALPMLNYLRDIMNKFLSGLGKGVDEAQLDTDNEGDPMVQDKEAQLGARGEPQRKKRKR